MRVLLIFGTRPEAIKMAPVILELAKAGGGMESVVCVTGQHREMVDPVLDFFGIVPDVDLGLMRDNQLLAGFTRRAVAGIDGVVESVRPEVVLVQGDATSAMVGALAGFYHKVGVGHVEAGLRTKDRYAPFPEEVNRRIIGVIAEWHFAPTKRAKAALLREGVAENKVYVTGNTAIDALLIARRKVLQR